MELKMYPFGWFRKLAIIYHLTVIYYVCAAFLDSGMGKLA